MAKIFWTGEQVFVSSRRREYHHFGVVKFFPDSDSVWVVPMCRPEAYVCDEFEPLEVCKAVWTFTGPSRI